MVVLNATSVGVGRSFLCMCSRNYIFDIIIVIVIIHFRVKHVFFTDALVRSLTPLRGLGLS